MKKIWLLSFAVIFLGQLILSSCEKNPADAAESDNTAPSLIVPFINDYDITYIQPFGVPLDFGEGDIRPHEAVDFGCREGVEFKASASGKLGNIWLNYPHSYQFNIVVNNKYIVHYCMEPIHISSLSEEDKLNAVYFSPGDQIEKGEKVCIMVGGRGHLDWGLITDNQRICPACHLTDEEYARANELFKQLPSTYEGYPDLCPENEHHSNPSE